MDAGMDAGSAVVDRLQVRHHLRAGGLDAGHVAALAELGGDWPPLVVWAEHPEVVLDGAHRLAAARRLGHPTVQVVAFSGSADEAFVEAVRRNNGHGLPLSLQDRIRAGQQILNRHPDWSDRRVAETCALSPHTVARLRATCQQPRVVSLAQATGINRVAAQVVAIESRLGKDGRNRPAGPGMVRERVVEALRANPTGSLREVAGVAHVSPETVRRIRREIEAVIPPAALASGVASPAGLAAPGGQVAGGWNRDPALSSSPELGELISWLDRTEPGDEVHVAGKALTVPLSRVYQLADEARRRAACWAALATALEARARGRRVASA